VLGNGLAFGVDVVPRPMAAAAESRAGVGDLDVEGAALAHAVTTASRRQNGARM
jgi:hypothetical protein